METAKMSRQELVEKANAYVNKFLETTEFYTLDEFLASKEEFEGVYCFRENEEIVYVGISRTVRQRIRGHMYSSSHFTASLAYKLAKNRTVHQGLRSNLDPNEIQKTQEQVMRKWRIGFIDLYEIDNESNRHKMMYLIEFLLAVEVDAKYSSFKTS